MAAFLVDPRDQTGAPRTGARLNIFPGSATPTVFPAGAPFWIGYGFVPEGAASAEAEAILEPATRFELAVDGEGVSLVTDIETDGGRTIQKVSAANFPAGLPVGWHRFAGHWYVAGELVLSSDKSIEFVER